MAKIKTRSDYEAEITELHGHDTTISLHKKFKRKLGKWEPLLNTVVRVAENEQNPWLESEIGLPTEPMQLKTVTGYNQVGDYIFEIARDGKDPVTGNIVIERKTCGDLYGTLMNSRQRERFYNELLRYRIDPRFSKMVVMVECSMDDFINYIPEIYVFRWDMVPGKGADKLARYLKLYYKIKDIHPYQIKKLPNGRQIMAITTSNTILVQLEHNNEAGLYIDGVRKDSLVIKKKYGNMNLYQCKGASKESKIATIAGLYLNNIPVQWCGSRERAVQLYRNMIRQSIIKDYARILQLEDNKIETN